MGVLAGLQLAMGLLPLLGKLIDFVEQLHGAGNGAIKKSTVMDLAQTAVETGAALSTGGQQATFERIAPQVGGMVDALVGLANAGAKIAGAPPVVEDGVNQSPDPTITGGQP